MGFCKKEGGCSGCSLEQLGQGFARASGWPRPMFTSDLLFLGEALGYEEAMRGQPFCGPAGGILNRVMKANNLQRELQLVTNVVKCRPPANELVGAPYEYSAMEQCKREYLEDEINLWLERGNPEKKVMVTLGKTPLTQMLGYSRKEIRVEDFHGTILRDPTDRFWIVPTFHPSFIQRGAFNLLGVHQWDVSEAVRVSREGHVHVEPDIIEDPPIDWFTRWADAHLQAAAQAPDETWLAVDIETLEKGKKGDEGSLTHKDRDFHILRVNFSNHPDEGITVPFQGPYIKQIQRLCQSKGPKVFWNGAYDLPRLAFNEVPVSQPIMDAMWMWHHLQSDLPRGLGFVSPFYSKFGPWKHLSGSDPVRYAAIDGFQTLRCAFGISADLKEKGMWEGFWRHVFMLDAYALNPSEDVGMDVDKEALAAADVELDAIHNELHAKVQEIVPEELLPLRNPLKNKPDMETEQYPIVEVEEEDLVIYCDGCQSVCKSAKHATIPDTTPKKKCPAPNARPTKMKVTRWYRRMPFNIGSPQQLMEYILFRGHEPGKDKKTKKPTTNKDTIAKLAKKTKDPLYPVVLRLRAVDKIRGTYIKGTIKRLQEDQRSSRDGRLHPSTGHKPSTQRLSQQNPNLQNVVARGADEHLASLFRRCLIAGDDSLLVEADFSGIEAVETGWFANDPDYIRLAWLGVHAYLASHLLYRDRKISAPASLKSSDADLLAFFKELKEKFPVYYDQAKRTVHSTSYGMTPRGLSLTFPELFPNERAAQVVQGLFFDIAKSIPKFQQHVKDRAARQGFLGGSDHPFGYVHHFFNVVAWKVVRGPMRSARIQKIGGINYAHTWGEDAKRAVAFYPQSTAAGVIKEAMLRLFVPGTPNYIGDVWHGRTPLRAQVHDSLVLEVPRARLDEVVEKLTLEMRRPIKQQPLDPSWGLGEYLTVGVEVKVGKNWASKTKANPFGMEKIKLPKLPQTLAADGVVVPLDIYDDDLDTTELEELVEATA